MPPLMLDPPRSCHPYWWTLSSTAGTPASQHSWDPCTPPCPCIATWLRASRTEPSTSHSSPGSCRTSTRRPSPQLPPGAGADPVLPWLSVRPPSPAQVLLLPCPVCSTKPATCSRGRAPARRPTRVWKAGLCSRTCGVACAGMCVRVWGCVHACRHVCEGACVQVGMCVGVRACRYACM